MKKKKRKVTVLQPNLWIHEEMVSSSNALVLSAVTGDTRFRSRIVRHCGLFDGG